MKTRIKAYLLFWLSGSVSQLGSAMTSFALILWTYTRTNSALAVSLMTFCSYLPYLLGSLLAGGFVDRHRIKPILLCADAVAAAGTLAVLLLWLGGGLCVSHIYLINGVIGFMNAFQAPAQSVAVGLLVPEDRLSQVSGLDSLSNYLVSAAAPVLAAAVFAFGGLGAVLAADLLSFVTASAVLLLCIEIPDRPQAGPCGRGGMLAGCGAGFRFLHGHRGLWRVVMTMAWINFCSRLTYENILSPMLLARSGGSALTLGVVNTVLGVGGILGGAVLSAGRLRLNSVDMIYGAAGLSFLCGDLLMGLGRSAPWWCAAALAASLPVPFVLAGQRVLLYRLVPPERQGGVFAARNAIQYSTIPAGILLGGVLADRVMEPFLASDAALAELLRAVVGPGPGGGMAVMFLCTGILGTLICLAAYRSREIRELRGAEERRDMDKRG